MAVEKRIPSRVSNLHDTEANWNTKTEFVPNNGEIIIYDEDDTHDYKRMKVGDGIKTVVNLDFATVSEAEFNQKMIEIQTQITNGNLQISTEQPAFACTWFRVNS